MDNKNMTDTIPKGFENKQNEEVKFRAAKQKVNSRYPLEEKVDLDSWGRQLKSLRILKLLSID